MIMTMWALPHAIYIILHMNQQCHLSPKVATGILDLIRHSISKEG